MPLFDTHCHLDFPDFDADRAEVLARARAAGVERLLIPGVTAEHWPRVLDVCRREQGLYPALGLHPMFIDQHTAGDLQALQQALVDNRDVVAVGEIGLDFFLPELDRTAQQTLFDAQLVIARDAGLPVVLHVRKAHDAVLASLKKTTVKGGIVHAFNGSLEQAQRYIEMGFKLGFGGMLTFESAHKLHRLARELPLDAIVLETDAPDMSGAAYRGQRNSPAYLPEYLDALITQRPETRDDITQRLWCNSCQVFNLHQ